MGEFRRADEEHIATTPERIRRVVAEHITAARDAYPDESRLVTHEAVKKRKFLPVRLLFQQAPHVLTALKPCWAMSPLVVSQVLPMETVLRHRDLRRGLPGDSGERGGGAGARQPDRRGWRPSPAAADHLLRVGEPSTTPRRRTTRTPPR